MAPIIERRPLHRKASIEARVQDALDSRVERWINAVFHALHWTVPTHLHGRAKAALRARLDDGAARVAAAPVKTARARAEAFFGDAA